MHNLINVVLLNGLGIPNLKVEDVPEPKYLWAYFFFERVSFPSENVNRGTKMVDRCQM